MEKSSKLLIVVSICAVVCLLIGAIVWSATEDTRYLKSTIKEIENDISEYRLGEDFYFTFFIVSSVEENPEFQDWVLEQARAMYHNKEYSLLNAFLRELESEDIYYQSIADELYNLILSCEKMEDALQLVDKLQYCDYYNSKLVLNRTSGVIAEYINKNGTNTYTTTPGEGYYANEKDDSSLHRVGLDTSPLYDATEEIHLGDFKYYHEYGVELNSYYEETSYSREKYYFRGVPLLFSPFDGECVWSGTYLFCFDYNGYLLAYSELK